MEETEIKRKFLPKTLPDLTKLEKEEYERYYLLTDDVDLRIQKINDKFEIERMEKVSEISRNKQRMEISPKEFELLKSLAEASIVRDSYAFSQNPEIKIRIYHGRFEGLIKVEVSFNTEEETKRFIPLDWFGKEITGTPLWRDSELLKLSNEEFQELLS